MANLSTKKVGKKIDRRTTKKVLSFFLIIFPTIIIALARDNLVVQALVFIYQAIILKQFVDDYYEVL